MRETPRVFISATRGDLEQHVEAASRAIRSLEWVAVQQEVWPATGEPSVEECLRKVLSCDALVVLVAHRYGWVPTAEAGGDGERSITWLEVETARARGMPVLAFLVDDEHAWPPKLDETRGRADVKERLDRFKATLLRGLVSKFREPVHLELLVRSALTEARPRLESPPQPGLHPGAAPADDVAAYLKRLEQQLRWIELKGFGEQFQVRLAIDKVYVPLRARLPRSLERPEATGQYARGSGIEGGELDIDVSDAFREAERVGRRGVVVVGDPGSGKTTAGRRLCWQCASTDHGPASLGLPSATVPVLLPLRRLRPAQIEGSLGDFLSATLASPHLADAAGLGRALWRRGRLLWVLDGLDEVADPALRERVSRWIEDALAQRESDRFLVTSRFSGYQGDARLAASFLELHVEPLTPAQQREFVTRWYETVELQIRSPESLALSEASRGAEALTTLLSGEDFRHRRLASMVANPLLLSILCVVHRKEKDFPRGRARLYAKCVDVLLEHWRREWRREVGRGAFDASAALLALEPLAHWMHQEQDRAEVGEEEAAAVVEDVLRTVAEAAGLGRDGRAFLRGVRDESGLLASASPGRYSFLHLTFQEFLAARHAVEGEGGAVLAGHFGEEWWKEVGLLALGLAKKDAFAADYFRAVLKSASLEANWDLLSVSMDEALRLPATPFAEHLREARPERAARLLRVLQGRKEEELLTAANTLARHPNSELRREAETFLAAAGRPSKARAGPRTAGDTWVDERTGVTYVYIPAGEFLMCRAEGKGRASDERQRHRVRVASLWLARTAVTNQQYGAFLKANPEAPVPAHWSNSQFNQPLQPVVGVDWETAGLYAAWAGGRLPSEAEWEYACRAGTSTEYWSGDQEADLARVGWYRDNSDARLHAVGERPANPWGLLDMHGNVWEWCEDDWNEAYNGAPADGSPWIDTPRAPFRVIRGGSWSSLAERARSAHRTGYYPGNRNFTLGLRLAKAVTAR